MSSQVDELFQAVLGLPDEDQLRLLAALTSALGERGVRPFDDSWLVEVRRRSTEFDSGVVRAVPWDEVKERARRRAADGLSRD